MKRALVTAVLLAGCMTPLEQEAAIAKHSANARRWADTIGMRITGVVCRLDGSCDVNPEKGEPFRLKCDSDGCALPPPPAPITSK